MHAGHTLEELRWPAEPLRTTLLRGLGKLGVARYAQKYEAVQVCTADVSAAGLHVLPALCTAFSRSLRCAAPAAGLPALLA